MKWLKKILVMFLIVLLGLGTIWTIMRYKDLKPKIQIAKEKIIQTAGKIPFIGKFFVPQQATEEKPTEEKPKEEAKPIEVKGFKVAQIHFTDTLPSIGTIRGFKKINLRFEVNGTISSFNFREGDLVEEGDIIAEINHEDSQLKVKFREAKLDAAKTRMLANKSKLDQHQKLFDVGAIIKVKLEEVQLEYQNAAEELKAAQVELESAKLELEKTYLKSPINGVMESKDVEAGEYVTSSVQIATLGEITEVYMEMGVIEKDIEKIVLGQKVTLKVDTYPEQEFTGEVDNIFPAIEGKSRTLTVRAKIANPENKLLPGMFTRGTITVYEKENAIIAPALGIDKTEEGYRVFIIDKDNVLHPKPVTPEYTQNSEYWVIGEGLEAGEIMVNEVVSAQLSQLKEGDKVEVLETEEYTF
jgi:membrane fusion protein (multidrug efflux system)